MYICEAGGMTCFVVVSNGEDKLKDGIRYRNFTLIGSLQHSYGPCADTVLAVSREAPDEDHLLSEVGHDTIHLIKAQRKT